ncbi:cellulose biosynthesis protein BcsO [Shimwellia blattae]|uniref:cellulose biosynthesis protein BcsO n=1 Tax=Shimwellia blattae TaxID=563 RepID=UPI000F6BCD13|nr:cellulose biosynthesis protein BcsO [Shimwellia blattae]VDY63119.1 Uncharacterised protein [Shimwellia blattae]VEC20339.1 Uncharacterised protein [Shimwellia blattae]
MSSNYDDLQRFRDKTQTNGIPFQEIATPKARSTRSDWNMINQVLAGEQENSPFPATVNTSRAAPQTVAPGMFTLASAPAIGGEPVAARKEPQPPARPAPVTPMGEVSAAEPSTLLKAMADIPVPAQPMAPVSAGDAGQITPAHSMPTAAANPRPPQERQVTFSSKPPVTNYSAMFAPAAAPASSRAAVRALSLHSVLERIASCR